MALALERHATSKLPDDAIELVATLGFRGEALPSIASVARLTLESRVRGARAGLDARGRSWRAGRGRPGRAAARHARAGRASCSRKVPARRKFLRGERSEYAACLDVVRRLAMARPDIALQLRA